MALQFREMEWQAIDLHIILPIRVSSKLSNNSHQLQEAWEAEVHQVFDIVCMLALRPCLQPKTRQTVL